MKIAHSTDPCPKCIYHFCHRDSLCDPTVMPLNIKDRLTETRSHLCQHASRIVGHYKIVFFMSCVRILWPPKLCQWKPADLGPSGVTPTDKDFVEKFHNVTTRNDDGVIISGARPAGWQFVTYPPLDEKFGSKIRNYDVLP